MDFSSALPGNNGKPNGGLGAFDAAEAAPEFTPIPPGIYSAFVLCGEYTTTKAGDDAYRMRFEVSDGPQTGQTLMRLWTFGPKAIGYTKRDLNPFGLTTTAKLLAPFPEPGKRYRVRLVVALKPGDDGITRNDIKRIELLGVDDSPAADFLLPEESEGGKA